jgi:hypothetical protein
MNTARICIQNTNSASVDLAGLPVIGIVPANSPLIELHAFLAPSVLIVETKKTDIYIGKACYRQPLKLTSPIFVYESEKLSQINYNGGYIKSFEYELTGLLVSMKLLISNKPLHERTFSYDQLGNLISISEQGQS